MPSTASAGVSPVPTLIRTTAYTAAITLTLCWSPFGWSATLPADLKWESNNQDPLYADPAAKRGGTFRTFMTSFPLTLRKYGPDSNGGFAGYVRETNLPLLSTHPVTGKQGLYVNRGFTLRIPQLRRNESDALLEMLYRHIETPEFQCRFKWQPNSVAFWDNRCTQHFAINDYPAETRVMHRVTVRGDAPF